MTAQLPPHCTPDRYLSKEHLQELFNDFNDSLTASRPAASVFSTLLTNVRFEYTKALFDRGEALLELHRHYEEQLAELRSELKEERAHKLEPYTFHHIPASTLRTEEAPGPSQEVVGSAEVTTETSPEVQGPTSMLGIYNLDSIVSDWVDWRTIIGGWNKRTSFKVFKSQQPGTVRFQAFTTGSASCSFENDGVKLQSPWCTGIHFWAFATERPGTQVIWVGHHDTNVGTIILKGDQGTKVGDWKRKFTFWVPI